jgi:preprotein translocase subunit SecG
MVAACPLACRRGIIPSTPIKHKGDIIVAVSFYINLVQIIISIALIVIILLQAKGSGLGSIFGGDSSIYKTRRGVEKTLFQATIGIVIAFFVIAILSVLLTG